MLESTLDLSVPAGLMVDSVAGFELMTRDGTSS